MYSVVEQSPPQVILVCRLSGIQRLGMFTDLVQAFIMRSTHRDDEDNDGDDKKNRERGFKGGFGNARILERMMCPGPGVKQRGQKYRTTADEVSGREGVAMDLAPNTERIPGSSTEGHGAELKRLMTIVSEGRGDSKDHVSMDHVSMDHVSMDQVSMDQVSMDQVSMDQVSMDQVSIDQVSGEYFEFIQSFDAEGDDKNYELVLKKFDSYFIPKRNVIHERACFYQSVQCPGERAESFIRSLYELAEHCEFGSTREEHIRDRIVVGIQDKELSRKLQLIPNLTLEMTVQETRQSEEVKAQVSVQGEAACAIQEVAHKRHAQRRQHAPGPKFKHRSRDNEREKICGRCGKEMHKKSDCPALKSTCNRCRKSGHWEKMCKSKLSTNSEYGSPYLATCHFTSLHNEWTVQLEIGSTPVSFKIDTGADVCIMTEAAFKMPKPEKRPLTAKTVLNSPGGRLNCIGQFTAHTELKNNQYSFKVFVIRGETTNNLLSRSVAEQMGLVKRIQEVYLHYSAVMESPSDDVQDCNDTHSDVECYVASIIDRMPASKQKMAIIRGSGPYQTGHSEILVNKGNCDEGECHTTVVSAGDGARGYVTAQQTALARSASGKTTNNNICKYPTARYYTTNNTEC
ncbi:hypothetical protein DPX16_13487 [Anabarilius grahami]|uniref:Peptidase A2 domain-containing protein n=1 Tax=Anabarilius grahami TaxID=495550 RepID=A0A3N0YBE0_ANAGA|nr:hypothetical protein DPX16_13487 [Anabarilius grahami]